MERGSTEPNLGTYRQAWSAAIQSEPLDRSADRAIVAAILDGNRDAYRLLVERESAALVRACERILGDHASAEDAAQEAFVTAFRALPTWRGDGPFGAWLTRIAVRIALREATKRRTVTWRDPTGHGSSDRAMDAADLAAQRASLAASTLTDPAAVTMRAEQARELREAVVALPEPYREVVAMRFFGDASLDEISRQTGRPLGTVKTHLHRGLARLRTSVELGGVR
jgi:RNA polymerase sigma-70 factor (ECF subfamily)